MTYEIYRYIFIGGAILSAVMFVTALLLFFVLHIPRVIGDLSGSTARKAIEDIRNKNISSGDKTYKSSVINKERGKITDKITESGHLIKAPSNEIGGAMATEKIATQEISYQNETQVLQGNETTILPQNNPSGNETVVLSQENYGNVFEIEFDITFIHTNEVIV